MIYIISLLLTFAQANTCSSSPSKNTKEIGEVCAQLQPKCLKEPTKSSEINGIINAPENKVSDDELFVRLIYAESLASGCDLKSDEIFEGIAWTLRNRIAKKGSYSSDKTARGVALKPQQFSSSTGSCDVARRTEFFCPTDYKGFEEAWVKASKAWAKTKSGSNPIPTVRHYFFPRHFDASKDKCAAFKGKPPSWEKPGDKVKTIGTCATFHNVKE